MNTPYPQRQTRPSFMYSNKVTIFLVILAAALFTIGYVLFQQQHFDHDDANKYFDTNDSHKNSSETPLIRLASKISNSLVVSDAPNHYRLQLPEPLFERVIRVRTGRNGRKKYLVKFFKYPALYWISEKEYSENVLVSADHMLSSWALGRR